MKCHLLAGLVRLLVCVDLRYAICRTDLEIRNIPVGTGKDQTMHTIIAGDEANPPLVLLPGNILIRLTSGFVCLLASTSQLSVLSLQIHQFLKVPARHYDVERLISSQAASTQPSLNRMPLQCSVTPKDPTFLDFGADCDLNAV